MQRVSCNNCGSSDSSVIIKGYDIDRITDETINVVRCRTCGLVYTNPCITETDLPLYYSEQYFGPDNKKFKGIIESLIHLKRRMRAAAIEHLTPRGRVLDIGCGRGLFLHVMRSKGWETYGIEVSDTAAGYAKNVLHLNVLAGTLDQQHFPDNHFDAITLYHVIEHLPRPKQTISEIRRVLKPGGILVISAPNIHSWQAAFFKMAWFHLDIPRHCFHFSIHSLKNLLPSYEWSILKIKTFSFEQGPFGWIQSTLNLLFGNENMLYTILKEKTTGTLQHYARRRFKIFRWTTILLNITAGALLFIPSTILSFILSLTGFHEVFEIYFRKTE